MIPNPIRKVLSTFQSCEVRALLMGGQACVFYGAIEFSRDTDFAILADEANLDHVRRAMAELQAEVIAVTPFDPKHLLRGHAVHFRCHHPDAERIRVDLMAKMRGVAPFPDLWERRSVIELDDGSRYDVMGFADLVSAKKTQRDKDWPMIRRLLEAHYAAFKNEPDAARVQFWLTEARTPELIVELEQRFPDEFQAEIATRPALQFTTDIEQMILSLAEEEQAERFADREYWAPLKRELEVMRHSSPF